MSLLGPVTCLSQIPTEFHFAIIQTVSVYISIIKLDFNDTPYETGKRCETHISYEPFYDEVMWRSEIERLTRAHAEFRAISVTPAVIKVEVTIEK